MAQGKYRNYDAEDQLAPQLRQLVGDAEELVALTMPTKLLPAVASELAAARERNVVVLALLGGEDPSGLDDTEFPANAVRYWEQVGTLMATCIVDYAHGLLADIHLHQTDEDDGRIFVFTDQFLGDTALTNMFSNHWTNGHEIYTTDPRPLPASYDSFFHAVIDANQHLEAGRDLHARVHATTGANGTDRTVEGPVLNVRQSIVNPITASFPSENSFFLGGEDELRSVGGPSAVVEDVRAQRIEFHVP